MLVGRAVMSYDVIKPLVTLGLVHVTERESVVLATRETVTRAGTVCVCVWSGCMNEVCVWGVWSGCMNDVCVLVQYCS